MWGFRTGMLTFSTRAFFSNEALYQALEKKVAGAIRSAVSNCSHASQSVLVKALSSDTILAERKQKKGILEAAGQLRAQGPRASPSMPSTGSRIPSTPVTSCA